MRFFIFFLSSAMLTACGQSQVKQPETHAEYSVCKKDKDCIVVVRCEEPASIHKKFLQSYKAKTAEWATISPCGDRPPPEIDWSKLSADCFENTCRVIGFEAQLESSP